jgi:hypothetical protein
MSMGLGLGLWLGSKPGGSAAGPTPIPQLGSLAYHWSADDITPQTDDLTDATRLARVTAYAPDIMIIETSTNEVERRRLSRSVHVSEHRRKRNYIGESSTRS